MNDYWRKIFSWSNSRQKLWDECKLAYYWRYIDKWEYPREHPFRRKLDALSALMSVTALQGSLMHEILEGQLNQHRLGRDAEKDVAQAQYAARLGDVQRRPEKYLTEAVNGQSLDEDLFRTMQESGSRQLENFFSVFWPVFRSLQYLEHEKFEHFVLDDKVEVAVKVDLVTRTDDNIVVTDWKTGQEREDHNEQMGIYELWAMAKYDVPATRVKGEIIYLDSSKQRIYEPDPAVLESLRKAIPSMAADMLAVQQRQDFPPDPAPWKCARCNYLTICEWGQKTVASGGGA